MCACCQDCAYILWPTCLSIWQLRLFTSTAARGLFSPAIRGLLTLALTSLPEAQLLASLVLFCGVHREGGGVGAKLELLPQVAGEA